MKLTLGFSTCPNDTFIFDALVNQKIDTENISFSSYLTDVEELNRKTFNAEIDITKISYHAFAHVSDTYQLLLSGSALGFGNGPLLISKQKIYPDEMNSISIAIPGKFTTANLLLSVFYPEATGKTEYLFSDIEDVVLGNEADAGLIIHENRFTYKDKGLRKIVDLGQKWETAYQLPIPLGGIAIRRSLPDEIKSSVNKILAKSIEYAFLHPLSSINYIRKYAKEMNEKVIMQHINLYVNEFTRDIGKLGKTAVNEFFKKAIEVKAIPSVNNQIFIKKEHIIPTKRTKPC